MKSNQFFWEEQCIARFGFRSLCFVWYCFFVFNVWRYGVLLCKQRVNESIECVAWINLQATTTTTPAQITEYWGVWDFWLAFLLLLLCGLRRTEPIRAIVGYSIKWNLIYAPAELKFHFTQTERNSVYFSFAGENCWTKCDTHTKCWSCCLRLTCSRSMLNRLYVWANTYSRSIPTWFFVRSYVSNGMLHNYYENTVHIEHIQSQILQHRTKAFVFEHIYRRAPTQPYEYEYKHARMAFCVVAVLLCGTAVNVLTEGGLVHNHHKSGNIWVIVNDFNYLFFPWTSHFLVGWSCFSV